MGRAARKGSTKDEAEIWGQEGRCCNKLKSRKLGKLSGGPVVIRTWHFYCCGSRFNLWLGN